MASRVFVEALTGSTSSVIANAIVYPLDVITTKVQVRNEIQSLPSSDPKDTSIAKTKAPMTKWQLILDIFKSKGMLGFYVGLDLALLQTFWSNFAYFYLYSWIKKLYYKYKSKEKGIVVELLQGALAGALSRLLTTPISVVTTRMQAGADITDANSNSGYRKITQDILKKDGIRGFWRGYKASLILTANPAITYGVFEYIKKIIPPEFGSSPWHSFIIGAGTKSIATIVTYPYILCKTRLQAGSRMGIMESFEKILKQEGVLGLFEGLNEQLSKSVLCQALLFALKDYLNTVYSWIPVEKTIES